jgi:hypothetical protein
MKFRYYLLNFHSIIYFRECICTLKPISCKATYDKIKKVILNQKPNQIDKNNPMLVAFDECMVEIISDPMPQTPISEEMYIDDLVGEPLSAPNPYCTDRITEAYLKCEAELRENVIEFIDVLKMMNEDNLLVHD